ncbi:cytochrome ubiquinol oxidase subunit II [uncultured Sphingomonas sp.]|uniref:cytochrome ubiquinol oxidase subunit II n=1 Tax=uncultured Sphingomonas sp. TaxID=158754 RepID=UPI002611E4D9|nr:cytochrome ubiquinol oxidase subunit II [uncultured Sphingomonas sp.]
MPLPLLLGGCAALSHGFLNAAGPVADNQRHLFALVAVVLAFIAAPVLLLVPLIGWHYRRANRHHAYRPKWTFSWGLEGLIWVPPLLLVVLLSVLLWRATVRDDPYRPLADGRGAVARPLVVQAIALDWKWLFVYPDARIAAVDQLAIPVGRPVRLDLTSATVMQSMLIPRLGGQIYAMPAMRTQLNLRADHAGIYRGANVQYNGNGFARQSFEVLALSPAEYAAWLARVRRGAQPLDAGAWAKLARRQVAPAPSFYVATPPGLFHRVMQDAR